jgi:DeoR/GlpR family transcriptional regulator of sugar metabolism
MSSAKGSSAAGPRDRQEQIRVRVVEQGFVRIEELAEVLAVSPMTIHRDLDALERRGWLRKVRGGASAQPSALFHGDVRHRMVAMSEAKEELGRAALGLVGRAQALMFDESTTALRLARLLPAVAPVTVISNFLPLVNELAGEPGIEIISLGGVYYPAYEAFLGMETAEYCASLRADVLFMSTTAVTRGACYHQSPDTVLVKRALMASSTRRVLLIDHTKFAKQAIHRLAPLTDFDLVVIDRGTDPRDVEAMRDQGVAVHVAGDPGIGFAARPAAAAPDPAR